MRFSRLAHVPLKQQQSGDIEWGGGFTGAMKRNHLNKRVIVYAQLQIQERERGRKE